VKTTDLHYDLPPGSIAQRPLAERDASRMMLLERQTGEWKDHQFRELPRLLRGDELIVVNNAKVIPARLLGRRLGVYSDQPGHSNPASREFLQAEIEVLLLREIEPEVWEVLVKPGRKVRVGEKIVFGEGELEAEVEGRGEFGLRKLRFRSLVGVQKAIQKLGHVPLPPYIRRSDETSDRERYQTVFARQGTAVAAPTASLHFTKEIVEQIRKRDIEIAEVTLEVGLGTFEPVRTEQIEDHPIHAERYVIPAETADAIHRAKQEKRPILAVGTTVVRTLEDAARKALANRTTAAKTEQATKIAPGPAEADIFILPGAKFHVVDQLLTNFHLPESTLLGLVAAFAGKEHVLRAYRHAVAVGYGFYSYGDCMLIR
jgi:S-adenosylmethionine:tRNA ribosyltransferase-isomerase